MNVPNPNVEGAHYVDAGSIAIGIGALFGWLPNVAALLTVVWMIIRIWETETVRNWVRREQKSHEADQVRKADRQAVADKKEQSKDGE